MSSINVLYTTGLHQEVYAFANVAEKDAWDAEVFAIKAKSAAAFQKTENEGVTREVRLLYENWKARVVAFKDKFSSITNPSLVC